MRFPYQLLKTRQPVFTLGGRSRRPRPVVAITVIGPTGTYVTDGWLDTAADDTVFPETIASVIGVNLGTAALGQAEGVGLAPVTVRFAQVTLRISQGSERREWRAWVGFTSARLRRPLLGFAGFLQFFTAVFHGDREEAELTVNSLYPGT
jgi:hypothetical protein